MKPIRLELVFDDDHHLPDIPLGAIIRIAPMRDENDRIFCHWVIDDATGEPLDLVAAECVRVAAAE